MSDAEGLPDFDELPLLEGLNLRHAWGVFGPDDQLGTINLLTPERIRAATDLVRSGEVVSLTLPVTAFDPPFYGRDAIGHTVFRVDRNYWDDRLDSFLPQGSSHWDGLRHMQAREFGWWGGVTDEATMQPGAGSLGIEHWARHGIVGRGLLLDLRAELEATTASYDPHATRAVGVDTLEAAAHQQGIETQPGDILCLRFGWVGRYRELDAAGRREAATAEAFAGLAADERMARWLWNRRLAAVAADNPAIEVSPGNREVGSLHRRLLPLLGFALGELFDFDELARRCAREGRWSFLFASVPLHISGGVGSPANAIA